MARLSLGTAPAAAHMAEYDAIAEQYSESKNLSFREHVERYTLFDLLGDVRGRTVLDMACGDGFYTRLLKQAGAATVTGVDISAAMIELAEERERQQPLGCAYEQADVAEFATGRPADLVVAGYLLNYAPTPAALRRMCRACHDALRPGGRMVGINDNVRNPPVAPDAWKQYGLERACRHPPAEGDVVRYTLTNADGQRFTFDNYYLAPETYADAFRAAGFKEFQWVDVALHPAQRHNPFWDAFMTNPPITAFTAQR